MSYSKQWPHVFTHLLPQNRPEWISRRIFVLKSGWISTRIFVLEGRCFNKEDIILLSGPAILHIGDLAEFENIVKQNWRHSLDFIYEFYSETEMYVSSSFIKSVCLVPRIQLTIDMQQGDYQ